jgi:hypothetical protein
MSRLARRSTSSTRSVQTLSQDMKDLDKRVRDLEDQTQQQQP